MGFDDALGDGETESGSAGGAIAGRIGATEALERGRQEVGVESWAVVEDLDGHAVNLMAKAYPNSRFSGWDFSEEGVAAARKEAAELGVTNSTFEVKDAATIDGSQQFDFITVFDAIHDQAKPDIVLQGIADSLRPDGVFLCVDIAGSSHVEENMEHPLAPLLYSVSTFHCMTVSLALDGAGLGTMWGEQKANEMFNAAGFTNVETKKLPEDIFNVYYVCRKD